MISYRGVGTQTKVLWFKARHKISAVAVKAPTSLYMIIALVSDRKEKEEMAEKGIHGSSE